MSNYAVFLEGSNFLLSRKGGPTLCGFFTTVRVIAPSQEEAGPLAIQTVWRDPRLAGQEANLPMPRVEVKVVHELSVSNQMKGTELSIFEMEVQ